MFTTEKTDLWSSVRLSLRTGQPNRDDDHKIYEATTSAFRYGTPGRVACLSETTLYPENPNRKRMPWSNVSIEKCILRMQVLLECYYTGMGSSQWES